MMFPLRAWVAAEPSGQSTVRPAIGVQHEDHTIGAVQPDALFDLLEHELAIALVIGRGERLRAPGNLDRVGVVYTDALQKLAESRVEAIIEAPDDRRVALVFLARRVEVE